MKQRITFQSAKAAQKEDIYTIRFPHFVLNAVAITHTGHKRSANEDNYGLVVEHDPLTDKHHALFVVADGMGGHAFGEEASSVVCYTHLSASRDDLSTLAQRAHTAITQKLGTNPGSTEVVLRIDETEQESHFHVGDSRIYCFGRARKTLEQLTEDDSIAWRQFRSGQLASKEAARQVPYKNYLNACIGTSGFDTTRQASKPKPLVIGDVYLLCSDGLWDDLSDAEIQHTIQNSYRAAPNDHRAAAHALVNAALRAGGNDNITVLLVGIDTAPKGKLESHFYSAGQEQFGKQLYAAAKDSFEEVLIGNPKNSWAHYYLGRIHHIFADQESAKYHFTSALKLRPAFATKDADEARTFVAQKEYKKALWAVERAAIIAPYCSKIAVTGIAAIANKVGIAFKDGKEISKDYTAATRAFTAALAADTHNADAHYHIGTIAMMQKDYTKAEASLRGVVQRQPNHRWAQYQLGRVYELTGNTKARDHYQRAAALGLEQAATALQQLQRRK